MKKGLMVVTLATVLASSILSVNYGAIAYAATASKVKNVSLKLPDGSSYYGEVKNGKPNGNGYSKFINKDEISIISTTTYSGTWVDGKRKSGRMVTINEWGEYKHTWVGTWTNNVFTNGYKIYDSLNNNFESKNKTLGLIERGVFEDETGIDVDVYANGTDGLLYEHYGNKGNFHIIIDKELGLNALPKISVNDIPRFQYGGRFNRASNSIEFVDQTIVNTKTVSQKNDKGQIGYQMSQETLSAEQLFELMEPYLSGFYELDKFVATLK